MTGAGKKNEDGENGGGDENRLLDLTAFDLNPLSKGGKETKKLGCGGRGGKGPYKAVSAISGFLVGGKRGRRGYWVAEKTLSWEQKWERK